jgi:mRNA interferase YafQ
MRAIERTSQFKRDYKREAKGQHRLVLDGALLDVLKLLIVDKPLPPKYRDHPLTGEWSDHRDCHIKPDLLLIYKKQGKDSIRLARFGSHSELFG